MNRNVCITISGLHSPEDEDSKDVIEVLYFGTYYNRNGKHYIRYDEEPDAGGVCKTNLLKIGRDEVEILSKGEVDTRMMFTLGKKNISYYATPFGGMNLGVDTYEMRIEEEKDRLCVILKYGLDINLEYVASCNVNIVVTSSASLKA